MSVETKLTTVKIIKGVSNEYSMDIDMVRTSA